MRSTRLPSGNAYSPLGVPKSLADPLMLAAHASMQAGTAVRQLQQGAVPGLHREADAIRLITLRMQKHGICDAFDIDCKSGTVFDMSSMHSRMQCMPWDLKVQPR